MFPKFRRKKNENLLKRIREMKCLICNSWPSEPDHITTRGAGGSDVGNNVWPLCREHHTERHKTGLQTFIKKHPVLKRWLLEHDRIDILEKGERNDE